MLVTLVTQGYLSTITPTKLLGKTTVHEHFLSKDGNYDREDEEPSSSKDEEHSSSKKKNVALNAKLKKQRESESDEDGDDESSDSEEAHLLRKARRIFKKLQVKVIDLHDENPSSSNKNPYAKIKCLNCNEKEHISYQCKYGKKKHKKGKVFTSVVTRRMETIFPGLHQAKMKDLPGSHFVNRLHHHCHQATCVSWQMKTPR
ncbi:hypothetical protein E2562_031466 [Oryza meyeriana var. granulata]|uniref:CCHC-type domain-containing protein n=1 Tax=Oryza meyeriana var. granulata TaxID=110450 RepID=A0A6G1E4R5_9ORYZ|nr:hypothetical protein E2562_031466 [Oryza meyeriana var. granulata]